MDATTIALVLIAVPIWLLLVVRVIQIHRQERRPPGRQRPPSIQS
jgi:hypothetical protein